MRIQRVPYELELLNSTCLSSLAKPYTRNLLCKREGAQRLAPLQNFRERDNTELTPVHRRPRHAYGSACGPAMRTPMESPYTISAFF